MAFLVVHTYTVIYKVKGDKQTIWSSVIKQLRENKRQRESFELEKALDYDMKNWALLLCLKIELRLYKRLLKAVHLYFTFSPYVVNHIKKIYPNNIEYCVCLSSRVFKKYIYVSNSYSSGVIQKM